MNLRDIFRTASANMLRSKLRTFLTIIAIFIGALTLSLTNGIGAGVSAYIDEQLGNIGADDALIIQQKQDQRGSGPQVYDPEATTSAAGGGGLAIKVLSEKDLETIRSQQGILSAEPILSATPEYLTAGGEKYKVSLSPFIEGTRLDLLSGSGFQKDSQAYEVILPVSFIGPLGLASNEAAVGKTVTFGVKSPAGKLTEIEAKVAGVQQRSLAGSDGVTASEALVAGLRDVQIQGLPEDARNQYPVAVARFDVNASEEELQVIKDRMDSLGYQAMTVEDTIGIIKQVIGAITAVLNFFAAIALVAASFGIINTLLMAVQERTKEIGLMKAMGMSGKKIFLLFSTEAVLLGFWGSLLGVVASNGVGRIVNNIASDSFLKDLPGFELMSFPYESMLVIMGIIMVVAFIAGTLPASRAAKQNPIDALRYE